MFGLYCKRFVVEKSKNVAISYQVAFFKSNNDFFQDMFFEKYKMSILNKKLVKKLLLRFGGNLQVNNAENVISFLNNDVSSENMKEMLIFTGENQCLDSNLIEQPNGLFIKVCGIMCQIDPLHGCFFYKGSIFKNIRPGNPILAVYLNSTNSRFKIFFLIKTEDKKYILEILDSETENSAFGFCRIRNFYSSEKIKTMTLEEMSKNAIYSFKGENFNSFVFAVEEGICTVIISENNKIFNIFPRLADLSLSAENIQN